MKGQITACGFVTLENAFRVFVIHWVKGQITACGFVTIIAFSTQSFNNVKGQITACGFVTSIQISTVLYEFIR